MTPIRYVALGDSTVEGIGASEPDRSYVARLYDRLRAEYPNVALTNLGQAGATAADVLADQVPAANAEQPALVTLSIGPNDLLTGVPAPLFELRLDAILASLTEQAAGPVVAINLLPDIALAPRFAHDDQAAIDGLVRQFNDAIRNAASRHGAVVADLYTASRDEAPNHDGLVSADGFHPSDAGYALWADYFWQSIAARLDRSAG